MLIKCLFCFIFFFFNDTATTEIYTLSLHDALPIYRREPSDDRADGKEDRDEDQPRSEEHTSELQSRLHLVCRLLLEKTKKKQQRSGVASATLTRAIAVAHPHEP